MPTYRKKSDVIEAVKWSGSIEMMRQLLTECNVSKVSVDINSMELTITNHYGWKLQIGEYAVKGKHGNLERWSAKDFVETYEPYTSGLKMEYAIPGVEIRR